MYAMVGSVVALAGIARITISLSVIMMECTINCQFGIPLFLAAMVAKQVGQIFNPGIYDVHLEFKHVPLLEPAGAKEISPPVHIRTRWLSCIGLRGHRFGCGGFGFYYFFIDFDTLFRNV